MTLSTRLACYSLGSLAGVLVGFSVALYLLADHHLRRQDDERLEAALNTLAAAAEVGEGGVEWEPEERSLSFSRRTLEGRFAWRVGDEQGAWLDGSATGDADTALARIGREAAQGSSGRCLTADVGDSRAMVLRLERPEAGGSPVAQGSGRHEALVFGVLASTRGTQTTLRNLALTLAGLSGVLWATALTCARRLCRAALRPVAAMAQAAHAIDGSDPAQRLPTPGSGDELDELGRSFNALLDRLGESLERQRRFAGDASHQLRTPLTAIKGHVEVALRQDRPPDEYRRVLDLVRVKSGHLRAIIDGLMFLAHADVEAMQPVLQAVTLDDWLDGFLAGWSHPRSGDVARAPLSEEKGTVLVHPPLLGELVGNLLDNAAKYSPPGTPIRVEVSASGDQVALAITNEGAGIRPADLSRIFAPFFRAEPERVRGSAGAGLGLSIAARIADAFGGRIRAESELGRGARFTLILPIARAVPTEDERPR